MESKAPVGREMPAGTEATRLFVALALATDGVGGQTPPAADDDWLDEETLARFQRSGLVAVAGNAVLLTTKGQELCRRAEAAARRPRRPAARGGGNS